jgi:hypothetical protein
LRWLFTAAELLEEAGFYEPASPFSIREVMVNFSLNKT